MSSVSYAPLEKLVWEGGIRSFMPFLVFSSSLICTRSSNLLYIRYVISTAFSWNCVHLLNGVGICHPMNLSCPTSNLPTTNPALLPFLVLVCQGCTSVWPCQNYNGTAFSCCSAGIHGMAIGSEASEPGEDVDVPLFMVLHHSISGIELDFKEHGEVISWN